MTERLYEGMFLLDANEASKGWSELEGHIDSILTRNSARLELAERWPDQRLAYDIKGVRKGTYYLTYFRAPPDRISEIRRDAQLSERILRLLVIHEDFLEQELERRREVAARRGREEPAAGAPV
ncbi:MAG: 30S ribosomal protein S6, partial [Planctomycetota bacterium]